ncbi:MAG: dihydropteroate synthase [Thiohalomonadales bacterium]
MPISSLVSNKQTIDLSIPVVMGILNMTPDSFSDGGLFVGGEGVSVGKALDRARQMVKQGAQIIDIGGESTRPDALAVSEQQELDRVVPVIEAIHAELPCVISIDSSKAAVMEAALAAGAAFINDVNALRGPGCLDVAIKHQVPVCLMHMCGKPRSMQVAPTYHDVVAEVQQFLLQRCEDCLHAGLKVENIIIDPGFGFGKSVQHNLLLVKHLQEFTRHGYPVLVGMSRKSTLGAILDKPVQERLFGSLAMVTLMAVKGARIFRVHDVAETIDVLKICTAVANS